MGEVAVMKSYLILCIALCFASAVGAAQSVVRAESQAWQDHRPLPEQTATAAVRDYLQSWQSLRFALEQNRPELLEPAFVGTAKEKFADTIQQQVSLGIRTRYQDSAHHLQIVFYSPDGLSIELTDKVDYDVKVTDHNKVKTAQHVSAKYIIVLTPAEVRWRVRVFQAVPE
jgi:hypothetical protein